MTSATPTSTRRAESRVALAARRVRPVGPVLAQTKFHIPELRPRTVRREALVAALVGAEMTKLTLVDAPPGAGKTSLLSQWHADPREHRPFAWISLETGDNDPVRFWDGVIAALQTIVPGLGAPAEAALHSPGTTLADHVMPLLINELAGAGPIVLVLDDYHVIEKPEIHQPIELLIDRLPPTTQLVIATRSDPPLPLSRLRARGQLSEVRAADLRFSADEADAFLNGVLGLGLDADDVRRLNSRAEGWAAGLQLAGLSLKGRDDQREFIDSFAGDDQQIVDYLGFEVLDRQPPALRNFLFRSAILDRLSGPLCAAVTGARDAEQLLLQLERENLFVVALDSRREWYRYHQLFAELLRHELARTSPELIQGLHRKACSWYREQGAVHEAIEHASAAGDFEAAIKLITTHWYEFLQRGRQETVSSWIDRLPPRVVDEEPSLCLTKAWLGVNTGRLDQVERWIEAAAAAAAKRPGPGSEPPLASGIASLRAIHRYMDGNVGAAVAAGRYALELERGGPASPWRPVGCPVLGLSLHWHGRSDEAVETLTQAVRIAKSDGNHLAAMHASGGLATINHRRGDYDAAANHAEVAIGLAQEHDLTEHWASSLSLVVRGQLLELAGDPEGANRAITRASQLAHRGVASLEIAYSLLSLVQMRARLGLQEEASRLHRGARHAVGDCADPGILRELLTQTRLQFDPRGRTGSPPPDPAAQALSRAELSVLRLLRSELSMREIGSELHLSVNTIKTHTRNIYRKLGVATRAEALAQARALSLI